jgi:hypothetical protein
MSSEDLKEVKRTVQALEERVSKLENFIQEKPISKGKDLSVNEFMLEKKPSSDLNKTLTVAFYLERHRRVSPFTIRDLEGLFREAKEPPPKNISDAVNKNVAKGFIMKASEKKEGITAWTLTNTGERFVEDGLRDTD